MNTTRLLDMRVPEEIFFTRVREERRHQDDRWGGPLHDDTHDAKDWSRFMQDYLDRVKSNAVHEYQNKERIQRDLIKIAALCLATYGSLERRLPHD